MIGAGVGGMATANILAKAGYRVTVYERHGTLGGRAGELKKKGFTFDTGPSWYLMPEVYEHYFNLLGESAEDYYSIKKMTPAYKVFFQDGDSVTIQGDAAKDAKTFDSIEKGSAKKLLVHVEKAELIYKIALKYFLYNPFTNKGSMVSREVLKHTPLLLSKLLQPIHSYISSIFKSQKLQQILEYHMVFLGASPYKAPAMYQLMSYLDFKQGVYYPDGGMYEIIRALKAQSDKLNVVYKKQKNVEKIIVENNRAIGVSVNGKIDRADIIISNSDLYHTENTMLEKQYRMYSQSYWSRRQAGPSALLMYLGVKGELPELEHHNLYFVDKWKENFEAIYETKEWPNDASIYISKTSHTDETAPKSHETVFVLVPLPASLKKMQKKTIEKYTEKYLAQIEKITTINDLRKRIIFKEIRTPDYFGESFSSWNNTALGMSHTLRQSAFFRPSVKHRKVKNLYMVGAGVQPGIGVPMCLISAELVYKHVIGDSTSGPLGSIGP